MSNWTEKLNLKVAKTKRLFMATMQALPQEAQAEIYNRLGVVSDDPQLGDYCMAKNGGFVTMFQGVCILWLRSAWLVDLTTKQAKYVIAHELAHVYHGHKDTTPELEQEADKQAEAWGFTEGE